MRRAPGLLPGPWTLPEGANKRPARIVYAASKRDETEIQALAHGTVVKQ